MKSTRLALKHTLKYVFAFSLVICNTSDAARLKYDVGFEGTDVGHMIFEADIGDDSQNIWSSLVDWNLNWLGAQFTSTNSAVTGDRLFVVNGVGAVIKDVEEELVFTCLPLAACAEIVNSDYPLLTGDDGSSLGFHTSDFVEGVLYIDEAISFGTLTYSGPSAVPLPAAAWLFGAALLGLGVVKRKKGQVDRVKNPTG